VNIAFSIADRVGILQHGVLHQCDTPQNIYEYPSTYFVAGYIGNMNFFYAKIISSEIDHYVVEIDDRFYIKTPINQIFEAGSDLFYAIRPERMQISKDPNISNQNVQKGIIIEKNYSAEYTQYFVKLEYGKVITVSMLNYLYLMDNRENEEFDIGQEIYVKWSILTGDLVYA
jgi:putrescine transport system ATP-binding protein